MRSFHIFPVLFGVCFHIFPVVFVVCFHIFPENVGGVVKENRGGSAIFNVGKSAPV